MPLSVRITALAGPEGRELWSVEPKWRDTWGLTQDDQRFQDVSTNSSYRDYVATLTRDEVLDLHEKHQRRPEGKLEERLRAPDAPPYYRVLVFEWESGLE